MLSFTDCVQKLCNNIVIILLLFLIYNSIIFSPAYAQETENHKVEKVWVCGVPRIPKLSPEEWRQQYEKDLLTKPKLAIKPQQNQRTFWAINTNTRNTYQVIAVLRNDSTQYARVWVELSINDSVSQDTVDYWAREFSEVIYRRLTNALGDPPDVDNDSKINILILDIDQDNNPVAGTAGLFWSAQEEAYDRTEIIYIDYLLGDRYTIAHEFTHMIHYNYDHTTIAPPNLAEEDWVDEGIADYGIWVVYHHHEWGHIREFIDNPDTSLTSDFVGDLSDLPKYGAAYLFFLYLSEKYGGIQLIRNILQDKANGIEGIENHLPRGVTFEDVFKNWIIANYLDGPTQNDDPSNPLWRYDSLDIQVSITDSISFDGQPFSRSDSVNRWAADYYEINVDKTNPDADNFYYEVEEVDEEQLFAFWSILILKNNTDFTVIEKSMLINQTTNFTESREYQKVLKEAEERGVDVKSIVWLPPPINANNTVTNAEKYRKIVIIVWGTGLDKFGSYTLRVNPIPDKHKTTNSLNQEEKAVYVIPVNIFGQPNPWNLYESNGDVFVSLWWESPRDLDVKLTLVSGKQGDVYYPETGIDERIDVVGKENDTQVWKLEIEERGNPSDPTIKIATNYLEGSVDDNQIFTLPTKLKINPINMFAGSASSPTQIEFEVEIYDGNYPFSFAPYSQPKPEELKNLFEVKIGGKLATILAVSGGGNKFKLTVAPPAQPSDGKYDLLVNFTFEKFGVSNTATALLDDAVEYGAAGKTINVDVALVIDSSGSMSWNDPNDLRKDAAKYFVDLLSVGDWVAVVDFDEYVVVWKHLTNITNQAVKNEIKAAIDKVDSHGWTNIGGGLLAGYNELNSVQTGNRKAAILLTDGFHNTGIHPRNVVPKYKAKGWPVYTIALTGDADEKLLRWIASETGGKFIKAEKAEDLLEIYNDLKKIIKKQSVIQKVTGEISQNESITQRVFIDQSIKSFDVSVSWKGSDLDLYLYYPNGTKVELNASSPTGTNDPNIYYVSSATYELYTVNNPTLGTWKYKIVAKQVTGKEAFTATVAATTEMMLSISIDKAEYYLNEPVTITATLTNLSGGIENANVVANITKPNGYVESLNLHDEGFGVYRILYTNTSSPGTYSVKVEANITGITRVAEAEFKVLSTQSPINVTPKYLDFGLSYPGDEKSVTFTIEYNGAITTTTSKATAFENLLRELGSVNESLAKSLSALSTTQSTGLSGVIIVGDFVGNKSIISATNVKISHPVIYMASAGKLNVTLTLNVPYTTEEGNYTSTVQIITNVGIKIVHLNLTVQKLKKSAVVNQIMDDLIKWLTSQTPGEKMYYAGKISDRLVYWRYAGG